MTFPATSLVLQGVTQRPDGAEVLRDVSVAFEEATFNVLTGDAGCQALLRVAGLLDVPERGEVFVRGLGTRGLSEAGRTDLRNRRFGFLFSAPYLLPAMTAVENVAMPLFKIADAEVGEAQRRSLEVLEFAGLGDAARTNAAELSPAGQCRAALARGLVHRPSFLLVESADAGLSGGEAAGFIQLLREVPGRFGAAVIAMLATPAAPHGDDRILTIREGVVRSDTLAPA